MNYSDIRTEEDVAKYFEKFFDPNQVKDNLTLASLYLSAFEVLKPIVIGNIRSFFAHEFPYKGEWDPEKIRSKEYIAQISKFYPLNEKTGKPKEDEFVACTGWLADSNVISADEAAELVEIRAERNKIAHELPDLLLDPEKAINSDLLLKLAMLINKIDKWWLLEVEIPTQPPDSWNGKDIDEDAVMSGRMMYMNHVFRMVFHEQFDQEMSPNPRDITD